MECGKILRTDVWKKWIFNYCYQNNRFALKLSVPMAHFHALVDAHSKIYLTNIC